MMLNQEQIAECFERGLNEALDVYLAVNGFSFEDDDPNKPKIICCSERLIFNDPLSHHIIIKNDDQQIDINDIKNRNTLFAVVSSSQGDSNHTLSQYNISVQIISEAGDFNIAFGVLRTYVNKFNYRSRDFSFIVAGALRKFTLVQSFRNPSMNDTQMPLFNGIRSLVSMTGIFIVKEPTIDAMAITDITIGFKEDNETYSIPYISGSIINNQTPDPQAFPHETYGPASNEYDKGGWTSNLNRQSTLIVTLTTYLNNWSLGASYDDLKSRRDYLKAELQKEGEYPSVALETMKDELETIEYAIGLRKLSNYIVVDIMRNHDFNKPIKIKLGTNCADIDSNGLSTYLTLVESWFTPTSQSIPFQLGSFSLPNLSFSETDIRV